MIRRNIRSPYVVIPAFLILGYLTVGPFTTIIFNLGIIVGAYGALMAAARDEERRMQLDRARGSQKLRQLVEYNSPPPADPRLRDG